MVKVFSTIRTDGVEITLEELRAFVAAADEAGVPPSRQVKVEPVLADDHSLLGHYLEASTE